MDSHSLTTQPAQMAPFSSTTKPPSSRTRSGGGTASKSKIKPKLPPPKQQKTKPPLAAPPKKKRRIYTEKELGIQKLNMVTPVGVGKPRGKKKGKIFVDDQVRSARIHSGSKQCLFAKLNGKDPGLMRTVLLFRRA